MKINYNSFTPTHQQIYTLLKRTSCIFLVNLLTRLIVLSDMVVSEISALKANHLEADLKIFYHAFPATKMKVRERRYRCFYIGNSFFANLRSIGCQGITILFHLAAQSLGEKVANILPALHALTGCDTTSRLGNIKSTKSCFS